MRAWVSGGAPLSPTLSQPLLQLLAGTWHLQSCCWERHMALRFPPCVHNCITSLLQLKQLFTWKINVISIFFFFCVFFFTHLLMRFNSWRWGEGSAMRAVNSLQTSRECSGDCHWSMDDRWELMVYNLTDGSQLCFLLAWRESNDYGAAK